MSDSPSRYRDCVVYQDGDTRFFGARPRLDTTPQPDDRFHVATDGDRIDVLAYCYFGDATLWWLIADWNDIAFPLDLPPSGTTLRIPSIEQVCLHLLD
jgi:hypothetical protein